MSVHCLFYKPKYSHDLLEYWTGSWWALGLYSFWSLMEIFVWTTLLMLRIVNFSLGLVPTLYKLLTSCVPHTMFVGELSFVYRNYLFHVKLRTKQVLHLPNCSSWSWSPKSVHIVINFSHAGDWIKMFE